MAAVVKKISSRSILCDVLPFMKVMTNEKNVPNHLSRMHSLSFHRGQGHTNLISTDNSSKHLKTKRIFENFSSFGYLSHVDCVRQYAIKRKNYKFPEIKAEDLQETFVRGSGPGGQAVNQTSNCVVLKHIPSGIVVKCQETRSLDENRKIARMRLQEKWDLELHGDQSYLSQLQSEHRKEKLNKRKKAKEKLAMKKAFKKDMKED